MPHHHEGSETPLQLRALVRHLDQLLVHLPPPMLFQLVQLVQKVILEILEQKVILEILVQLELLEQVELMGQMVQLEQVEQVEQVERVEQLILH